MKDSIEAIYEYGVFRPLKRPGLSEGQYVRLIVETTSVEETTDEMLELAAQVYEGLSDPDVDDVERIAFNRRRFFREKAF